MEGSSISVAGEEGRDGSEPLAFKQMTQGP